MMNSLRIAAVAVSMFAFGSVAFAKGAVPAQNHHCKMADGTMDMAKTKAECKTAKGTWAKDAAAAAKAADPAPAAAAPAADPAKK